MGAGEAETHCAFSLERRRGFFSVEGDASGGRSTHMLVLMWCLDSGAAGELSW